MNLPQLLASRKNLWLFSIIFIEGYVVLATELLAIRLLVPFVGSGTEVISIIISAVLLPLAIGYYHGSKAHKKHWRKARYKKRTYKGLRSVILKNLLSAMALLVFGLSYFFLEVFFRVIETFGGNHALVKASIYSLIFLVYPVYLLGQTIPIMSNYFSKKKLSEATGAMLFFSTIGSFLGSVFSTLVLMMQVGVNNTVIFTLFLVLVAIISIRQKILTPETVIAFLMFLVAVSLNKGSLYAEKGIYSDNAYNLISITEDPEHNTRTLSVNRSFSSRIASDPADRFAYVAYLEDNFINNYHGRKPHNILVIGAGGLTLGRGDDLNHYHYVDIDPAMKEVSEKYFLKEKLGPNKEFIVSSARAFLNSTKEKYDLVVVDAYTNLMTIPPECITQEFFLAVKKVLKPDGIVAANFIMTPDHKDLFSVRLANTFGSVFPNYQRQVIGAYAPWDAEKKPHNNIFVFINRKFIDDRTIYTDDRNTYSLDKY